jgi:hypothetical protein
LAALADARIEKRFLGESVPVEGRLHQDHFIVGGVLLEIPSVEPDQREAFRSVGNEGDEAVLAQSAVAMRLRPRAPGLAAVVRDGNEDVVPG